MSSELYQFKIAVVIPCYKVKAHLLELISRIDDFVDNIYLVDDNCPEDSVNSAVLQLSDHRIRVIKNSENLGVGGSVMAGVAKAIEDNMDIIVKIDGDGQMDPKLIPLFVQPIIDQHADCTKGNRFYTPDLLQGMPFIRIFGNATLSLLGKFSTGYWDLFDINNGYIAAHRKIWERVPRTKVHSRFFFESDLLFRFYLVRALVLSIPMKSVYRNEKSNLVIKRIMFTFLRGHILNFIKRIIYCYFIRDMGPATISLIGGSFLLAFSLIFGSYHWYHSFTTSSFTPTGTIMIPTLSFLLAFNFFAMFFYFDSLNTPKSAIHPRLS